MNVVYFDCVDLTGLVGLVIFLSAPTNCLKNEGDKKKKKRKQTLLLTIIVTPGVSGKSLERKG